jgi:hypothetical protein
MLKILSYVVVATAFFLTFLQVKADNSALIAIFDSPPVHQKNYRLNKKIITQTRLYRNDLENPSDTPKLILDTDNETVHDAHGQFRLNTVATRVNTEGRGVGYYYLQDFRFNIFLENDRPYIRDFNLSKDDPARHVDSRSKSVMSFFDGKNSIELVKRIYFEASHRNFAFNWKFTRVFQTQFHGRTATAVITELSSNSSQFSGGIRQTSYFDPTLAYIFLGATVSVPEGNHLIYGHKKPHQQLIHLEYHPGGSPKKLPLPKRLMRHILPENWKTPVLEYECIFQSYDDYTPTPEDFQLEKRYGLTTPTSPSDKVAALATKDSVTARRLWPWIVLIAVGGLLGYMAIRRSRQFPPV